MLRVVDALQLTASKKVSTPADWMFNEHNIANQTLQVNSKRSAGLEAVTATKGRLKPYPPSIPSPRRPPRCAVQQAVQGNGRAAAG
ncbi:unnamed protein product [Gongylonema pulchrum]|uniref:Transposase n=1 Tax=Gongylonema pulchrum TaxID=637853 RepID=A0A183DUU3_9BILA|nr:unnamed protein product [Gongylonema pulchrum]